MEEQGLYQQLAAAGKGRVRGLMIAVLAVVVIVAAALASRVVAEDSTRTLITGVPLPLYWGMPKDEIVAVLEKKGLHLAEFKTKTMQPQRYHTGKIYDWAMIKEEHLQFLDQRRFIRLALDENDRLVRISMKLLHPHASVHIAEHINIGSEFPEHFGPPIKEDEKELGGGEMKISTIAFRMPGKTIFETEAVIMRTQPESITTFANLYWDQQK